MKPANERSSEARKLVLGFDAGCITCSELARKIEEQVGDKLEVRSLYDPQMVQWREQALGEGAPWAPTLVKLEDTRVKAWTGLNMGVQLSRTLGPVTTWRIMQVLGEMKSVSKTDIEPGNGLSRRQFIKGVSGAAVAMSILAGTGRIASIAEAAQKPKLSAGTPALRKKVKAIVRSSKQYRKLLRETKQKFDFSRAEFTFEFSHEQFKQSASNYREMLSREDEATFSAQSRCSNCRTSRRNRCNWVIWGSCTVGGRVLWWLGAACGFLAMYSGNKRAGCAAWARSTCYKDGYC